MKSPYLPSVPTGGPPARPTRWNRALTLLAAGLAALLLVWLAPAAGTASQGTASDRPDRPSVASPHGKIHGQRLSGWLATFYSHALELPSDVNPLVGTGDPCPVVDGVLLHYGIDATTVCTVPEGTPVLVPSIIAPECDGASSGEFHGGPDLASLLACAHRIRANFGDETFTLDGAPVRRLDRYMVETDRFVVTYPADNPFGVDPGPTFAGAVGTTLIFKHLQPGEHTITNTLVEKSDPTNIVRLEAHVVVTPR